MINNDFELNALNSINIMPTANTGQALKRPGEMRRRAMQRMIRSGVFSNQPIDTSERQAINQAYQDQSELPANNLWSNILKKYYRTISNASGSVGHLSSGLPQGYKAIPINNYKFASSANYGQRTGGF